MTLVMHHRSVGGGCTLEVGNVSITSEVTFEAGAIH